LRSAAGEGVSHARPRLRKPPPKGSAGGKARGGGGWRERGREEEEAWSWGGSCACALLPGAGRLAGWLGAEALGFFTSSSSSAKEEALDSAGRGVGPVLCSGFIFGVGFFKEKNLYHPSSMEGGCTT